MVIKENAVKALPTAKWFGNCDANTTTPLHLLNKNVAFYKKCIFGAYTFSIGDCILVSNADATEPDTIAGCDIGKILQLFELQEMSQKDPYRAIVQWYSRPKCIPHKEFDNDNVCIDFERELIEEHRPYDADISLETIFRKCIVINGTSKDSAIDLLEKFGAQRSINPMFVCRYKFIKVKKSYRLVPLEFAHETATKPVAEKRGVRRKSICESAHKSKRSTEVIEKKRRPSVAAPGSVVEFIDMSCFGSENKVSPIKIVGGRSVVRLSVSAKKHNSTPTSRHVTSPLIERNARILTPTSRAAAARRNLNLSLDKEANSTVESDCLNYSIVRTTPDVHQSNDMKIKLRLSERRRSTRLGSLEKDPLASTEVTADYTTPHTHEIYNTPSRKTDAALSTRRKSILKSGSRVIDGTPKRCIQLSDIVEKRIFENDDIIATPKRGRPRKNVDDSNNNESTPTKIRRRSSTKQTTTPQTHGMPLTPSQKLKQIRAGEISPTMKQRQTTAVDNQKSDLQLAREQLHVSAVPKSLPCREVEFNNIYTFLESKIQDECGGCMYVSGVPGTGKTATVTAVIRMLQSKVASDELAAFHFLEINGMRLTEPRQSYVQIYRQLTGKTVSWEHAHALLEKRFTTPAPRRKTTVLLVDELDILCNRRQDVVYNLLDWPTKSTARLVVVTIANTMDLPERLLMGKVTSRLGLTRLTFQPYTHKQLQEIVTARLSGSNAFRSDALQLVARKVAAVSGDARRALDICRRATEIADMFTQSSNEAAMKCVNMLHVQQALAEMIASAKVQSIKKCSTLEQIFLQAVVAEVTRTGVEETCFMGVYDQIETIAAFKGVNVPTPGRALRICAKLGAEHLLICEHTRNDIFQKILLNVSADDIHYAIRVTSN